MKIIIRVLGFYLFTILFMNSSYAQTATFNYSTATGSVGATYSWIDCSTGGTEIVDANWTTTGGFSAADDGYININFPLSNIMLAL